MNTHRAVIEALDNTITLVASGPEQFCRDSLLFWIEKHPLAKYDTPLILCVVTTWSP